MGLLFFFLLISCSIVTVTQEKNLVFCLFLNFFKFKFKIENNIKKITKMGRLSW